MRISTLLTRDPLYERDGVLNFLVDSEDDYCANFGDQWTRFRSVQLDSAAHVTESHDRFFSETGWTPTALKDAILLDAGCGAGRFAEIALQYGAYVVAADLSDAVYACKKTLRRYPSDRYLVIRADIYDLPLKHSSFSGVYSLGVLQHTPDPLGAIKVLVKYLQPGGQLATWIYERRKSHLRFLQPRVWIRWITRNWQPAAKLRLSRALTAAFFPVGWLLSFFGRPGQIVSYFLPYACRHHLRRGSWRRQWDYCVMDTYDWYGPRYEIPQAEADVITAYRSAGLVEIRRTSARGMAIVGRRQPVEGASAAKRG